MQPTAGVNAPQKSPPSRNGGGPQAHRTKNGETSLDALAKIS